MKTSTLKMQTNNLETEDSVSNDLKLHKNFENGVELKAINDRPLARYFYSIKNQKDFYFLGNSFLDDFKEGQKSFAFMSENNSNSTQKILMAMAGYFDHVKKMRIAIITNAMNDGEIAQLKRFTEPKAVTLTFGPDQKLVVDRYHDHIDLFPLDGVFDLAPMQISNHEYERAITSLINQYDLILWGLPELSYLNAKSNIFFPIAHYLDSYSLIVREGKTKMARVKEIQTAFADNKINFKGIILDNY